MNPRETRKPFGDRAFWLAVFCDCLPGIKEDDYIDCKETGKLRVLAEERAVGATAENIAAVGELKTRLSLLKSAFDQISGIEEKRFVLLFAGSEDVGGLEISYLDVWDLLLSDKLLMETPFHLHIIAKEGADYGLKVFEEERGLGDYFFCLKYWGLAS